MSPRIPILQFIRGYDLAEEIESTELLPSGLRSIRSQRLVRQSGLYILELAAWKDIPAFFKVGFAKNINQRLSAIQCSSPFFVFCVYFFADGAEPEERLLQSRWVEHHFRGEWFHAAPTIVDEIRNGTVDAALRTARVAPVTRKQFFAMKRAKAGGA